MTSYRLGFRYMDARGTVVEEWQRPGESDVEFYARFELAVQCERPPVALIQYL